MPAEGAAPRSIVLTGKAGESSLPSAVQKAGVAALNVVDVTQGTIPRPLITVQVGPSGLR